MTEEANPRSQVLSAAYQAVEERGDAYGDPHANFTQIADLWTAAFGWPVGPRDVALALTLLKIARLQNGGGIDSWVDIAGYAACGGEVDVVEYNMLTEEWEDAPVADSDEADEPTPEADLEPFLEAVEEPPIPMPMPPPTIPGEFGFTVDGQSI